MSTPIKYMHPPEQLQPEHDPSPARKNATFVVQITVQNMLCLRVNANPSGSDEESSIEKD